MSLSARWLGGSAAGARGRQVPGYEVLDLLSRGVMGVVYRARQKRLDRLVALKLLSAEGARDLVWLGCFRCKGLTASALNHPHGCTIYGTGECGPGWNSPRG
jgi:serine/threonine protein kinase